MSTETILLLLILLSGAYMAWNIGANDVANAMGTSVGSGALTLRQAVLIAAVLEFSGAFFFGQHVSETIQSGIIQSDIFSDAPRLLVYGMIGALIATGLWLQVASYFGWPVSTTHGIVGGVIGFGAIIGGAEAIYWDSVGFIVASWIISPLFGGVLSYIIFTYLRRHVLYTVDPVGATKKLAPVVIFVVITTLSMIMIYSGLKNLNLQYSFLEAVGLSLILGGFCALIGNFFIQKLEPSVVQTTHPYSSEVANELDKAKRNMQQALAASRGEARYRLSSVLEEVEGISLTLKETAPLRSISTEYKMVEKIFGYFQILSACMMAFAHGANDVANAIGPVSAAYAIIVTGVVQSTIQVPTWALAMGGFGIVIGLATWGWRVIETIGKKITELTPTRGFAAEFGAAATILIASRLGLPISTTHTLVGSVIGVGMARGIEALDLSMTRDIVISWIVTVPICALLSVGCYYILVAAFG